MNHMTMKNELVLYCNTLTKNEKTPKNAVDILELIEDKLKDYDGKHEDIIGGVLWIASLCSNDRKTYKQVAEVIGINPRRVTKGTKFAMNNLNVDLSLDSPDAVIQISSK